MSGKRVYYCRVCGKQILSHGKVYCSRECRTSTNKSSIVITCPACGRTFKATKKGTICCSKKCYGQYRIMSGRVRSICEECNKVFYLIPSRVASGHNRFCSRSCRDKFLREHGGTFKKDKIVLTCMNCGAEFYRVPHLHHRKFCSIQCFREYDNKSIFRTIVRKYEKKIGGYPYEFDLKVKRKIRRREGFACVICGKRLRYRGLSVHHINYIKEDLSEDNLIAMCQSCHQKTNYHRQYWIDLLCFIVGERINGRRSAILWLAT